jgi:hypothetical protein
MTLFCVPRADIKEFCYAAYSCSNLECVRTTMCSKLYRAVLDDSHTAIQKKRYGEFVKMFSHYRMYSLIVTIDTDTITSFLHYVNEQEKHLFNVSWARSHSTYEIMGFNSEADVLMFKLAYPR